MSDLTVKELDISFYATLLECAAVYETLEETRQKEMMSVGMANTPFPSMALRRLAREITNPVTLCDTVIKQFTDMKEYMIQKKSEIDAEDMIRSNQRSADSGLN